MTLDEAIKHAREKSEEQRKDNDTCAVKEGYGCKDCAYYYSKPCIECAEEHEQLAEWLEELKEYRDLEEQGMLLKLPCKVGDTYWELEKMFWVNEHKCKGCKFYFETLEDSFCDCDNDFPKCTQILEKKFSSIKEIVMNMDEINKTIFLTKEEAEKALERLECAE